MLKTDAPDSNWDEHTSKEWYELQECYLGDKKEKWCTVAKFTDLNNEDEALAMLRAYMSNSRPGDLAYRMVQFAEHYTKVRKVLP